MTNKNLALFIHDTIGKPFSRKSSVMFISLHKCATFFFSRYVLHHLEGRTNINFQNMHFHNQFNSRHLKTRRYGYVYGVIRILDTNHPSRALTDRLLTGENLKHKKKAFLIRDPRDILVSMYYSFGFNHPSSPNKEIRAYQEKRRQKIQQMTIDEYAIHTAPELKKKFAKIAALMESNGAKEIILLKFEDMVNHFDDFYHQLNGFIKVKKGVKEELFEQTRPMEKEHPSRHKRKGQPGDYKEKLEKQTIKQLNQILEPTLRKFAYPI